MSGFKGSRNFILMEVLRSIQLKRSGGRRALELGSEERVAFQQVETVVQGGALHAHSDVSPNSSHRGGWQGAHSAEIVDCLPVGYVQ